MAGPRSSAPQSGAPGAAMRGWWLSIFAAVVYVVLGLAGAQWYQQNGQAPLALLALLGVVALASASLWEFALAPLWQGARSYASYVRWVAQRTAQRPSGGRMLLTTTVLVLAMIGVGPGVMRVLFALRTL